METVIRKWGNSPALRRSNVRVQVLLGDCGQRTPRTTRQGQPRQGIRDERAHRLTQSRRNRVGASGSGH